MYIWSRPVAPVIPDANNRFNGPVVIDDGRKLTRSETMCIYNLYITRDLFLSEIYIPGRALWLQ